VRVSILKYAVVTPRLKRKEVPMSELLHDDDDQPPLYAEICQYYFRQIIEGVIRPGELLPAAHHVAWKHGTSAATARRGLRLLAKIGFAQPVPGHSYMALYPEP
jgi:DNA-binding transcriptional regulator YhcF (GntR family)